jgi:hypothetical protein
MDIDSINGGTIDTKGWLNPTVGTLRAKKVICDDIESTGGTVPNLGWSSTTLPNFAEAVTAGETIVMSSYVQPSIEIDIATELVPGSVWEVFASGTITPLTTSAFGSLSIGVGFSPNLPSLSGSACVVKYNTASDAVARYEYHGTFRVVTGAGIVLLGTTNTAKLVTERAIDGVVNTDIAIQEASQMDVTIVDGRVSVALCASALGSSFGITRPISYLRRIA